jgi:hypothetical protein
MYYVHIAVEHDVLLGFLGTSVPVGKILVFHDKVSIARVVSLRIDMSGAFTVPIPVTTNLPRLQQRSASTHPMFDCVSKYCNSGIGSQEEVIERTTSSSVCVLPLSCPLYI